MDTIFFYLSKVIWILISPDSLLLILIILSLILFYIGKSKQANILLATVVSILTIISLLPIGEWLLYPLESQFKHNPELPKQIDGIIVLSGAENTVLSHVWEQVELNSASERDLMFLSLANKYPKAKLIFTGGTGNLSQQTYKGADVAKKLFKQLNFKTERIIFERESRNTYENIIYSKKIIKPNKNEKWIVITTSWHMPRSIGIFCKAEWITIPYPVDHQTNKDNLFRIDFDLANNLLILKKGIKEWVGLFAYYATGKTTSIYPQQCS